jgi:hypothetical protein
MGNNLGSPLLQTLRDAYKTLPRPPFGKSDHVSILPIPAYKQKLEQEAQVMCLIWKWSDEADAKLQAGICSFIHLMALRNLPHQSPASLISASTTLYPQ